MDFGEQNGGPLGQLRLCSLARRYASVWDLSGAKWTLPVYTKKINAFQLVMEKKGENMRDATAPMNGVRSCGNVWNEAFIRRVYRLFVISVICGQLVENP